MIKGRGTEWTDKEEYTQLMLVIPQSLRQKVAQEDAMRKTRERWFRVTNPLKMTIEAFTHLVQQQWRIHLQNVQTHPKGFLIQSQGEPEPDFLLQQLQRLD